MQAHDTLLTGGRCYISLAYGASSRYSAHWGGDATLAYPTALAHDTVLTGGRCYISLAYGASSRDRTQWGGDATLD